MADTYNSNVNYTEGWSYVNYNGSVDLSGNLTSNHYSQAFLVGEANQVDAGMFAINSGGDADSDTIVTLEVSNDGENWQETGTIADLDGDGASAFGTVGTSGNTSEIFHAYKWARVKVAGQTSNTATTVDWSLHTTKNEQALASTTSAGSVTNT